MGQIKIASFNAEWMFGIFSLEWPWTSGTIHNSFPGGSWQGINLEAIEDIPQLCGRIAGVIQDVGPQIIGILEGPPLISQMKYFVKNFLNDDYIVYHSNDNIQTINALVHKSIANKVTAWQVNLPQLPTPWKGMYCYPWGEISATKRQSHYLVRKPLLVSYSPSPSNSLGIMLLHTKSKYSLLKTKDQWDNRDLNQQNHDAVMDALYARTKLSAEVKRIREFLGQQFWLPNSLASVMVMGDLNDGFANDVMEEEFLIHNIVDELAGTLLEPDLYFRHAMTPHTLSDPNTKSTHFYDPFQDAMVDELIDHILVSPAIWQKTGHFSIKTDSGKVERQAYDNHNADLDDQHPKRHLRPSDHRPVSVVIDY
jgi:hypothetical protein